jgi:hypothetical protein
MLRTLIFLIIGLFSSNPFAQRLAISDKVKQANLVEIHFLKGKKPSVYKTKRAIDLTYLKDLITEAKNNPSLKCDTTGIIIYFNNNIELAKVYFSSKDTGSKFRTGAVILKSGDKNIISLINYGTGMLLDEKFYSLKKSQ